MTAETFLLAWSLLVAAGLVVMLVAAIRFSGVSTAHVLRTLAVEGVLAVVNLTLAPYAIVVTGLVLRIGDPRLTALADVRAIVLF